MEGKVVRVGKKYRFYSEAEAERLRRLNEHLVDRLAAACEVLGKIANQERLTCPVCQSVWTIGEKEASCAVR